MRSRAPLPSLPFLQVNEHKNLAPPKAVDGDVEAAECPICFLTFEALNEATCCKQMICTDCYLLVKNATKGPPQCPFCSHKALVVRYTPSLAATAAVSGGAADTSALGTLKQAAAALLPPSIAPRAATPAATPTAGKTPGGEGKTGGTDSAGKRSPASPVHVPLASVTDRQELERDIQSLRNRYAEDAPPQVG